MQNNNFELDKKKKEKKNCKWSPSSTNSAFWEKHGQDNFQNLEPNDNFRKHNTNNIPNKFILLRFNTQMIQQKQNKSIFKLI